MSAPELTALKNMPISFPGLFGDWEFNPDPIAIHIGHGVYWYGIILALGFLAGLLLCMKQAKRYGLTEDHVLDFVLWAVPCCILGSRIYYVIFYLDLYRDANGALDWSRVIAIWDGGIAIYGTVIAGALTAFLFTRLKKIPFGAMADLAVMGLLLGQIIGRWANFINREAFGGLTDLPWRMRVWTSAYQYVEVHPKAAGSTGRTPGSTSSGTAWAGPGSRDCGRTACISSTGSSSASPSGSPRP